MKPLLHPLAAVASLATLYVWSPMRRFGTPETSWHTVIIMFGVALLLPLIALVASRMRLSWALGLMIPPALFSASITVLSSLLWELGAFVGAGEKFLGMQAGLVVFGLMGISTVLLSAAVIVFALLLPKPLILQLSAEDSAHSQR